MAVASPWAKAMASGCGGAATSWAMAKQSIRSRAETRPYASWTASEMQTGSLPSGLTGSGRGKSPSQTSSTRWS